VLKGEFLAAVRVFLCVEIEETSLVSGSREVAIERNKGLEKNE